MEKTLVFAAFNLGEFAIFERERVAVLNTGFFAVGELLYEILSKAELIPYQNAIYHFFFQIWSSSMLGEKDYIPLINGVLAFIAAIVPEKFIKENKSEEK